jgi:hypothetical protein
VNIEEIFNNVGIKCTDINTHYLINSCPSCGKSNKLRVDKTTGKWICFVCYDTAGKDEGCGNLWTLLPKYGLDRHEVKSFLKDYTLPIYTDDFEFKRIEEHEALVSSNEPLPEITLPYYFFNLECTKQDYERFPEAYNYLFNRKVQNFNLIKKYNLKYSSIHKRIIFPFYDEVGRLVGYQGRDITNRWKVDHPKCDNRQCNLKNKFYFRFETFPPDECPSCGCPLKPCFYPKTMTSYDFRKSDLLINLKSISLDKPLVLVEGPFDWINTPNSIPLLGKTLSDKQLRLIISKFKDVYLYLDGDMEGTKSTIRIYSELEMFIQNLQIVLNDDGQDPGQFSYHENFERIKKPISYQKWLIFKKLFV